MFIREIWGKLISFTREISKFQKSELGKFIPNFPLKHAITSTNNISVIYINYDSIEGKKPPNDNLEQGFG